MRRIALAAAVAATLMSSASTAFQGRRFGRFGYGPGVPDNPRYDGAFMFCRIIFRDDPNGDGNGWWVDYPRADTNLTFRYSELTTALVSRDSRGEFNHVAIRLTDAQLFRCPFIMMTEPGGTFFDEDEAKQLREYLLHGGFLWADDFWGEYAWEHWANEMRKVFPDGYPIKDIPMDHALFHVLYDVRELPQIPAIDFYFRTGGRTSERGADSAVPHMRGIEDEHGNLMVVMTHNTDFGDAFEREGESREYFDRFAGPGYAVGINVLLYSMTH